MHDYDQRYGPGIDNYGYDLSGFQDDITWEEVAILQSRVKTLEIENSKLQKCLEHIDEERELAWDKYLHIRKRIRESKDDSEKQELIAEAIALGHKHKLDPERCKREEAEFRVRELESRLEAVRELHIGWSGMNEQLRTRIAELEAEVKQLRSDKLEAMRSARSIRERLGWKDPSEAQQDANLDFNLNTTTGKK